MEAYQEQALQLERQGKTVMFLADDRQVLGMIAVADQIKEHAQSAIQQLQAQGLAVYMVTGDNQSVATTIGQEVGISPEHIFAEVLPDEKAGYVEKLQNEENKWEWSAMVSMMPRLGFSQCRYCHGQWH